MNAAEFKIMRERLGVSGRWLADRVGVLDRQVRRWEAGVAPIPTEVELLINELDLEALKTAQYILNRSRLPSATRVRSYRNDQEYWAEWPDMFREARPASFYRAALGRVLEDLSVPIEYGPKSDPDLI